MAVAVSICVACGGDGRGGCFLHILVESDTGPSDQPRAVNTSKLRESRTLEDYDTEHGSHTTPDRRLAGHGNLGIGIAVDAQYE